MSFQPTQISGCAMWLDAADPTTITLVGSKVSNWIDKSGSNNNAFETNDTYRPTYESNNSRLFFNSGNNQLQVTNPDIRPTNIFIVANTIATGTENHFFRKGNQGATDLEYYFRYTTLNNLNGGYINSSGAAVVLSNAVPVSRTNQQILSMEWNYTTARMYQNGTQIGTDQSLAGPQRTATSGATNLRIGAVASVADNTSAPNAVTSLNGYFYEIIFFNRMLTTNERQQIEGYLAWKWGLQSSLPITQPYRLFPPTSLTIQSSTELNFVNTFAQNGTINLPPAASIPGRILTFKDIYGNFGLSTATLSTTGGDLFEDNTNLHLLREPFGSYSFVAGLDNKWYTVGGSQMNTANISSIFTLELDTQFISSGNVTASTLRIIDSFSQSPTTIYNQSTLMYYSSQNGLALLGPTKAPRSSLLLTRGQFQPNQVASLRLWYDAADVNTIQLTNGNNVSRWLDKSGFRYDGFQTTPANRPKYNPGAVTFNGVNSQLIALDPDIRPSNAFIVLTSLPDPLPGDSSRTYLQKGAAQATGEFWIKERYNTAVPQYHYQFFTHSGTTQYSAVSAQVADGWILNQRFMFAARFAYSNALNIMINGVNARVSGSGVPTAQNNLTSNLIIGSSPTNTQYFDGDFHEILMFNQRLSDSNRQQVEGYLAWKWNIVSSLPVNHPYKYFPP